MPGVVGNGPGATVPSGTARADAPIGVRLPVALS
jgi:hypothetical protein